MAAESNVTNEIFNVGTAKPQTVLDIVKLLNHPITHIPKRAAEPDAHCADINKIQKMLGWNPEVSFEDGMQQVVDSIK